MAFSHPAPPTVIRKYVYRTVIIAAGKSACGSVEEAKVPERDGASEGIIDVVLDHIALGGLLQLFPSLVLPANLERPAIKIIVKYCCS